MTQHYTTNTKLVSHYCPTCNRMTMHRVDFKRVGSCTEHLVADGYSRKQLDEMKRREQEKTQPGLF